MPAELARIPWRLTDLAAVPKNGLKVFSTFACGGGSTMGYKLAGFEVIGCVEIDPKMLAIYKANHHPRLPFEMPIQDFNRLPDSELPAELFGIDILDGSPPCSTFSLAGNREDDWGKKKEFREGQASQILDDLFFHFVDTARKLRPKVVVAENVKGMLVGNARGYVKQVMQAFSDAGYDAQVFLLNSSRMGVPQRRERVFFLARRRDLNLPMVRLEFAEPEISVADAFSGVVSAPPICKTVASISMWKKAGPGEQLAKYHPNGSFFNWCRLDPRAPAPTVTAAMRLMHYTEPRLLSGREVARLQSFPDDFDFLNSCGGYVCGMSVPPLMMQRLALVIENQWFTPPGR